MKIGDFFRAVRSYEADLKDPVDSLSFKAALAEDTQKKTPSVDPAMFTKGNGPVIHVRDLPRRAVGEIVDHRRDAIPLRRAWSSSLWKMCTPATPWKPIRFSKDQAQERRLLSSR